MTVGALATLPEDATELAHYVRRRPAERLGSLSRDVGVELQERGARLKRVEERVRGLHLQPFPPVEAVAEQMELRSST
jgi:hypothetical protein